MGPFLLVALGIRNYAESNGPRQAAGWVKSRGLREITRLGLAGVCRSPSFFNVPEWFSTCLEKSRVVLLSLSSDLILVYVLNRSGCVGRLTSGRVRRDGGLMVFDRYGRIIEYLSAPAGNIRSWSVMTPDGAPVDGWCDVQDEDRATLFAPKSSA